jgi:ketosteroid isomerase-like protein
VDLALRAYAAFNEEDWETLKELFAPDLELHRAGGMGTLHGSETVLGFAEPDAFEWQRLEPQGEFLEQGDKVLIALTGRVRGKGSEIEMEQALFHVATIRGGRVARIAVHFDRTEALDDLRR